MHCCSSIEPTHQTWLENFPRNSSTIVRATNFHGTSGISQWPAMATWHQMVKSSRSPRACPTQSYPRFLAARPGEASVFPHPVGYFGGGFLGCMRLRLRIRVDVYVCIGVYVYLCIYIIYKYICICVYVSLFVYI